MKKLGKIKTIVFDALFLALIFAFAYIPMLGYISIGPLSFTTMHILVIIGACLFGYKRGALYGFFFGVTSLLVALQKPGMLDYFSVNPFISILPRVLFGLISGLVFDFFRKRVSQRTFNILVLPLAGVFTLMHTILFFVCFYAFGVRDVFGITTLLGCGDLVDQMNQNYGSLLGFIGTFMSIGCVCEIAAAIILNGALYIPLSKFLGLGRVIDKKEISVDRTKANFKTVSIITFFVLLCVIILSIVL